jgi:hypothetical protein
MDETMNTYEARYWREGDNWEVELVDDGRVHTFASTLGRARRYIREATAAMYDLDVDRVSIDDVVELPDDLGQRVELVLAERATLEQATVRVGEETRQVVADLIRAGLSVRDAGDLVHLSPQRVSQLARQAG